MKNILKIFLTVFYFSLFLKANAQIVYPIQTMSKPECRFQDFSTLGDDCKQNLPILNTKDYKLYKNNYDVYRRVYTVLWGSSYDYGWDVGYGGHQGVDIATAKGTPVYNIFDGKVIFASFVAGWGNVIKIEHNINGTKIYSGYAHLSKINVSVGDELKTNTKIGEVGSTGNSTGNHLHFQIDSTKSNSLWYRKSCKIKDYDTIVNSGLCFDELNSNTVDPLLFLESKGAIIKADKIEKPTQQNISKQGLLSNKEILKREIDEFLSHYDIKIEITNYGGNIIYPNKGNVRISVKDKNNKKPFTGSFPGDMGFKYNSKEMSIFPSGILLIENGFRDFSITPKKTGSMSFEVFIGENSIQTIKFGVFDIKNNINAYEAVVQLENNNVISDIKKGNLFFKTKDGLSLLGVPFSGKYTLTSIGENLKFCVKKIYSLDKIEAENNTNCSEFDFVKSYTFNYSDTIMGGLFFNYKIIGPENSTIQIKNEKGTIIYFNKITHLQPLGIQKNHNYYNEMLYLGNLGIISGVKYGYYLPDNDITLTDTLIYIKNTLDYLKDNCNDKNCILKINEQLKILKKLNNKKYDYIKLSRIQFLKIVNYFIKNPTSGNIKYKDLDIKINNFVLSTIGNNMWKDNFGQNGYFQPNQKITRAEGAYIIYTLISK